MVREEKNKIRHTLLFSSKKGNNSGKVSWNNYINKKNSDIFPLISLGINERTMIQKIINQCDMKHIIILPMKSIISVLNVLTYIITARPIGLTEILVIMLVSTFIATVILYLLGDLTTTH